LPVSVILWTHVYINTVTFTHNVIPISCFLAMKSRHVLAMSGLREARSQDCGSILEQN
jgi:hypothetical protein